MHISDFEMLRRMADEIDRLQLRVTDLTETTRTGVYHHQVLYRVDGGYGGVVGYDRGGFLFDENDIPIAKKVLLECRDNSQAKLDELRKKFSGVLASYKPKNQ